MCRKYYHSPRISCLSTWVIPRCVLQPPQYTFTHWALPAHINPDTQTQMIYLNSNTNKHIYMGIYSIQTRKPWSTHIHTTSTHKVPPHACTFTPLCCSGDGPWHRRWAHLRLFLPGLQLRRGPCQPDLRPGASGIDNFKTNACSKCANWRHRLNARIVLTDNAEKPETYIRFDMIHAKKKY